MDPATVENAAMKLTEAQRAVLVERLIQSLVPPSSHLDAWKREVASRSKALDEGKLETVDGPTFVASLRAKINEQ